jgi:hypothetical protein
MLVGGTPLRLVVVVVHFFFQSSLRFDLPVNANFYCLSYREKATALIYFTISKDGVAMTTAAKTTPNLSQSQQTKSPVGSCRFGLSGVPVYRKYGADTQ